MGTNVWQCIFKELYYFSKLKGWYINVWINKYEEIYGHEDEYIFIDVRSQKEAFEEPMIGSVNIPVLLNEERDVVGTLYVRESAEAAKEQGIEFISRRLPEIFKQVQELYRNKHGKKLVIFCARGGMRSGSLHSLLNS